MPSSLIALVLADRSAGEPLGSEVRQHMEIRFRADFGGVRVHTDQAAAEMARGLSANAFTRGDHIYFRGPLDASTLSGVRLLSHELAHVLQNRTSPPPTNSRVSSPGEPEEVAAEAAAEAQVPRSQISGFDRPAIHRDYDPEAAGMSSSTAPMSMVAPQPPGPREGGSEVLGRWLSDDPAELEAMMREWVASGDLAGLEAFVAALRESISSGRGEIAGQETFAQEAAKYPGDVSGTPWSAEEFGQARSRVEHNEQILSKMESWLANLHVRVDAFKAQVIAGAQVRIEGNRRALADWHTFIETKLAPEQFKVEALAQHESDLAAAAAQHPVSPTIAGQYYQMQLQTHNPAMGQVYERVVRYQIHSGCQLCHESNLAWASDRRTASVLEQLVAGAESQWTNPIPAPQGAKPGGVSASQISAFQASGLPAAAQAGEAINQIAPYMKELGPSGYQVLPDDTVTADESPAQLRARVVAAIERRRSNYAELYGIISAPGYDYVKLQPVLKSLLPLQPPEIQGAIQSELRARAEAAEDEALLMWGVTLVVLLLTIFPPTAPIGIALGYAMAGYGLYQGYEAIKEAQTLSLATGTSDVFSKEQQEAAGGLLAMGALNIVLSALHLGSGAVKGVKLVWPRGAGPLAAGDLLEGVQAQAGGNHIEIKGLNSSTPEVVVTDSTGAVIQEGPLDEIATAGAEEGAPVATSAPAVEGPQPASWADLESAAERPTPRQSVGGYRSQGARVGDREVITIEGRVSEPISQTESLAKYTPTLAGEHATHAVGMQLGENLPEGILSGPGADLNLSALKTVENATRDVFERATEVGASVETKTTVRVVHQMVGGEDVSVIVGVRREATVRLPGSDTSIPFVDFEVAVDPVTRVVTPVRSNVVRP
jgi:uncharacterized protein DUF4157